MGLRRRKAAPCQPPCGFETACKLLTNGSWGCICPHDLSIPTPDHKCPSRGSVKVATPQPIKVIIPPTSGPIASTEQMLDAQSAQNAPAFVWDSMIAGAIVLGLLFVTFCISYVSYRRCRAAKENSRPPHPHSPGGLSQSKGLLEADRYTPNPQYSLCMGQGSPPVPQVARESVRFIAEIGEGCFGKVYKGELMLEEDEAATVAVKVLKDSASREAEENFMREVEVMAAFKHPNILSLLGVVPREGNSNPWMLFEFMPHGDLAEVLRRNSPHFWKPLPGLEPLNKASLLSAARQVAAGMQYLASQRFVHRDLACRNCLVGEGLSVKIADFGMSRDVYTCDYYKVGGSRLLPVRWMAPESVTYGRFTLDSDIWSFGVVLWEIFSLGKQPYYGKSNEEVVKLITQGQLLAVPPECPSLVSELMHACWRPDPKTRIRFSDLHEQLAQACRNIHGGVPRPPVAFPARRVAADLVDADDYLLPQGKQPNYLQPLPD